MKLLQQMPSWILHYHLKAAKTTKCLGKTNEILYLLDESLTAKEQEGKVYIPTFFSAFAKRMKLLQQMPLWILHYHLKAEKQLSAWEKQMKFFICWMNI